MKTVWTSGLKDGQLEGDITSSFKSSSVMRKRLKQICEDKANSSFRLSKDQYETSNWTYLQADAVGYQRALKEIISLIENK